MYHDFAVVLLIYDHKIGQMFKRVLSYNPLQTTIVTANIMLSDVQSRRSL